VHQVLQQDIRGMNQRSEGAISTSGGAKENPRITMESYECNLDGLKIQFITEPSCITVMHIDCNSFKK
jgi:hypothetical protein